MPTLDQVAHEISGVVEGNGSLQVTHVCEIKSGDEGGLTYLVNPKYRDELASSPATAVIIDGDTDTFGKPAIRVKNATKGFAEAIAYLHPVAVPEPGIHPSAVMGENVTLGDGVYVGPLVAIGDGSTIGAGSTIAAGVVIGANCEIGRNVRLDAHVVLYDNTILGDQVIIQSNSSIGSDGYGYTTEDGMHHKIPHMGNVVLHDRVEIGSNVAIDRGTLASTVIGEGTKIGNLTHIAHNVQIGQHCLLTGQIGIAGSTVVGDYVTIAGQVGIISHATVGDRVIIASKAAVMRSVPAGSFISGMPAADHKQWLRQSAAIKQLPEAISQLRNIENRMRDLEDEKGE